MSLGLSRPILIRAELNLCNDGCCLDSDDGAAMQRVTKCSLVVNKTSETDPQPPTRSDSDEDAGMLRGLQALLGMLRAMMT